MIVNLKQKLCKKRPGHLWLCKIVKCLTPCQVWPKYLDLCFLVTFGVTLILSYTIPGSFVQRWLQVIVMGGLTLLVAVSHSASWLQRPASVFMSCLALEQSLPKELPSMMFVDPDKLSPCITVHEKP